jgi:formylglycine-generating enzyme required for sulfatase activity/uncharacterized caspase-like protein
MGNWAITIGINGYRFQRHLNYAKSDAEAMRDLLTSELKIVEQVYHFSDDSPPILQDHGPPLESQPTYATLKRFLRVRFEKPFLQPEDNLWFFFSGHGDRYQGHDYLMALDTDPGDIAETGIPLQTVSAKLCRSGAGNIFMFADACRKDEKDASGFGEEKQQGVISLFSCSPSEASYEIEELQKGAFTHALIEGLRKEGNDNCATVDRLYQHLRKRVPQLTQQYKRKKQTPYARIEPPGKLNLLLLPQKADSKDINALKAAALRAQFKAKDLKLAKQLWLQILIASPGDLEAIEGIEEIARTPESPVPQPAPPVVPPPIVPPPPTIEFDVVTITRVEQRGDGQSPNVITASNKRKAEYQTVPLNVPDNALPLQMILIPGGTFMMGSPNSEAQRLDSESPQHKVTVPQFLMSRYPITQAQWKVVAGMNKIECDLETDPSRFKGDNRPVECISWYDAVEFCARLSKHTKNSYRLPSEAEWEYACRAGTKTPFHFGETITPELSNYDGNYVYNNGSKGKYRKETTPVDHFGHANAFGLSEMHGNVWEWCSDHWHENYIDAPTDGKMRATVREDANRVLRGGSWNLNPRHCRSAIRDDNSPDNRNNNFGLRVVCSLLRT